MPIIQPDLSQVQTLAPISEGTYPAKITAVAYGVSKSSGTPQLTIDFEVYVGDLTYNRRTWVQTAGAGAFNFTRLLRACHMKELAAQFEDKNLTTKPDFDTDTLLEQELNVQVVPDIYQNELRDKISGFLPQ